MSAPQFGKTSTAPCAKTTTQHPVTASRFPGKSNEKSSRKERGTLHLLPAAAILEIMVRDKEPRYQGLGLSSWVETYCSAVHETERKEASQAILSIGSNAVPHLLRFV